MNKKKLEDYRLKGSVHTVEIKSAGVAEAPQEELAECITSTTQHKKTGEAVTKSIINPNKLTGDVFGFREFQAVLGTILAGSGIEQYNFVRTDMRFDSYDPQHYERYAKLNRYLISLLAVTYQIKNVYRAEDFFTQKQLSIAAKNDYFQIENYDRARKSETTGNTTEPAQSRIEIRTTSRSWRKLYEKAQAEDGTDLNMELLKKEFMAGWPSRWEKVLKNVAKVHDRYNTELEKLYRENKNCRPKKWRSLTDFVIQHQNCIFCKEQLEDLFSRFPDEVTDPKTRAKNFKKKYGIEFFSKSDILAAIAEIRRATEQFFAA